MLNLYWYGLHSKVPLLQPVFHQGRIHRAQGPHRLAGGLRLCRLQGRTQALAVPAMQATIEVQDLERRLVLEIGLGGVGEGLKGGQPLTELDRLDRVPGLDRGDQ